MMYMINGCKYDPLSGDTRVWTTCPKRLVQKFNLHKYENLGYLRLGDYHGNLIAFANRRDVMMLCFSTIVRCYQCETVEALSNLRARFTEYINNL